MRISNRSLKLRQSFLGLGSLLAALVIGLPAEAQQAIPVSLKQVDGQWQLWRQNAPYRVRGAGGEGPLELLAQLGGNSSRTWGVGDDTQQRLDEAQRHGISVALGIWLEHERHGFDYGDEQAREIQLNQALDAVRRFKDHPAVLVWGIGNEMEGEGNNPQVWEHIESICRKVKEIDPDHPTMTVIAEMGEAGDKVKELHRLCPSVDIVGLNSYGGVASVPRRYREAGGTKPYLVTEFGPIGTWEIPRNEIGAIPEPSSTAKAKMYAQGLQALEEDTELCLGSYAFLWGHKQEGTPTWFGLLLEDGSKLAAVDTLSEIWTGSPPANRCPQIEELRCTGNNTVKAGESLTFRLRCNDPEQDTLEVRWVLRKDAEQFITGGDLQAVPPDFSKAIKRSGPEEATVTAPSQSGLYRIYAYVDDGQGAAVANVPFLVVGEDLADPGRKVKLPYVVFDESDAEGDYAASGWMGESAAIGMDFDCRDNPQSGSRCLAVEYRKTSGWGGVVWQHPANDWGDRPGGLNLSGARQLSFWVRGEQGGERVTFGLGVLGRDKDYFDTTKLEREIVLTQRWRKVTLDVSQRDLRRIKTGFFWSAAAGEEPLRFYVDRVIYE